MLLYDRPEPLKRCAMVLSSVRFIKEECSISASQEHLLNSIPGWEDSNVNADFTPDELQLSAPQVHAARSVSSSSTDSATYHYGDLESQDWVEWGSPDDSFNGAFESDRDQSPRRESFSTNLFNEQSAQSHVPGSQVDELNQSAAIPLAQACDAEDPADMPRAQNCLSPRRSEGGQKFSTEAQFRAATDLSPTRNVSALRFPVSTGSASSLDRLANHSNSTASPCASPSASEDPNRRYVEQHLSIRLRHRTTCASTRMAHVMNKGPLKLILSSLSGRRRGRRQCWTMWISHKITSMHQVLPGRLSRGHPYWHTENKRSTSATNL